MITFTNVSKVYPNGFEAVQTIDFTIQTGEFIVLIGPSGSGKSTTMKMINRMIPHTSGEIEINGENILSYEASQLRRNIGYVIQQVGLFPHYTIEKNIAIVPQLKGWSKEQQKERVTELLTLVGLDPETYRNRYPKELSGGQQQRVGIARALAADPDILLMDEPFSALDPITKEQLQSELLSLHQKLKKTIVFVTHDMDEAIRLGDRIAIMKEGQLIQLDTPEQILHTPANAFVEQFIGAHRMFQNPELVPVTQIMAATVATAYAHRTLARALTFIRQRKMTNLLILDEQEALAGIVSGHDIVQQLYDVKTVGELVQPIEHVLRESASAKDAIIMMDDSPFGLIPILKEETDEVLGVVTRGSLLSALSTPWTEEETEMIKDE